MVPADAEAIGCGDACEVRFGLISEDLLRTGKSSVESPLVPQARREMPGLFAGDRADGAELELHIERGQVVRLHFLELPAAGTSTGGMTGKRWGRIGDSPVIGAGTWADDRACAVSATGWGEYFIRVGVAHAICDRMLLADEGVQQAADTVMADVAELGGDGGVIVVSKDGEAVFSFNTPGMYRGRANSEGMHEVAIFAED